MIFLYLDHELKCHFIKNNIVIW